MNDANMEKYARLIVKTGINLQKGQPLVVNAPIECAPLARLIGKVAFVEGASDVVINWRDELFSRIRYDLAPSELFDEFPEWQRDMYMTLMRKGAGFISIAASDPELMKGVEPDRMIRFQKASNTALMEYREALMANRNPWCVVSMPTESWARKVFPEATPDEAVERLWDAILTSVRVDKDDPVAEWDAHKARLKEGMDFLNSADLASLHLRNGLGTDLRIDLPEGHIWMGGSDLTESGVEFIPNMPTEEIFTLPHRTGVNGTVVASMPLNYNGNLIEGFRLTFENGRVVEYSAEKGYEHLKGLLETDEGAGYLGEVALVPYDSPISNTGILFYNTLFDENASCHLALGKAYPVCLKGNEGMDKDELTGRGVNDSLVHEDFMFGSMDLEITGTTRDGREVPVFKSGNWAR